jgi:hypothetical protein
MVMSSDQNAGQNHNIKTGNKFFERVEQFKNLEITMRSQNSIYEEIKSREVRECLLSFTAESFVFQFAIKIQRL